MPHLIVESFLYPNIRFDDKKDNERIKDEKSTKPKEEEKNDMKMAL